MQCLLDELSKLGFLQIGNPCQPVTNLGGPSMHWDQTWTFPSLYPANTNVTSWLLISSTADKWGVDLYDRSRLWLLRSGFHSHNL